MKQTKVVFGDYGLFCVKLLLAHMENVRLFCAFDIFLDYIGWVSSVTECFDIECCVTLSRVVQHSMLLHVWILPCNIAQFCNIEQCCVTSIILRSIELVYC